MTELLYDGVIFCVLYTICSEKWVGGYALVIMGMYYGSLVEGYMVIGPQVLPALGCFVGFIYGVAL